jgi:hypothetical protein
MRMTWLEMIKDILNDMDSDPVDFWDDTTESQQVAQILKTTYFNLIDGNEWGRLLNLFQLTETGAGTPTHMTIPESVVNMEYIKYDVARVGETRAKFKNMKYLEPRSFMSVLDARNQDAANVVQVSDPSGITLNIHNHVPPTYWTSFTDQVVVFDAFETAVDSYLQTSKTQGFGKTYPIATIDNTSYPNLPVEAFSYLLAESKSTAFLALKQAKNDKAEQHSTMQRRRMAWNNWTIDKKNQYPDFGRKSAK